MTSVALGPGRAILSGRIASEAFYGPKPATAQHCIQTGANWTSPLDPKKKEEWLISILIDLRVRAKVHPSVFSSNFFSCCISGSVIPD